MKKKLCILCALAVVLFFASLAGAQPPGQCRALDALGKPIPKATIHVWRTPFMKRNVPPTIIATSVTDEHGDFSLPVPTGGMTMVRIFHPAYGAAEASLDFYQDLRSIFFPLVKKGTDAEKRGLRGVVLDSENRPVGFARVQISRIWALGHWLEIQTLAEKTVFTDQFGRFAICPPVGPDEDTTSSAPIPPICWYDVTVVQPDFNLFPDNGTYKNSEDAVIRLLRPGKFHRFVFLGPDGQSLPVNDMGWRVELRYANSPSKVLVRLPARYITERVKLAPGRYSATYDGGDTFIPYPEITVTPESPMELTFRSAPTPRAVTFVGRVVDGVTGKPLPGVFVTRENGTIEEGLEALSPKDWQTLSALSAVRVIERHHFGKLILLPPLVRTDEDGKYNIALPEGKCALTVFGEGLLPICIDTQMLRANARGLTAVPVAAMFPAAKVLVKLQPNHPNEAAGHFWEARYDWLTEKEGRPEWFDRLPPRGSSWIEQPVWQQRTNDRLISGEENPLFVPAGLQLRLRFGIYLHPDWFVHEYTDPIILLPGESKKIADLSFSPALEVTVRVTDMHERPLQWIAVKQVHGGRDDFVIHDTDSGGAARFKTQAGDNGQFVVKALEELLPAADRAIAGVAYSIPEDATKGPEEPLVITLTDEQIELLSKIPPPQD